MGQEKEEEEEEREKEEERRDGSQPRLSSLVVVGGIGKGKLQPVGFGQQHAHFLVAPVHCGKVLQEDHQALLEECKNGLDLQFICFVPNLGLKLSPLNLVYQQKPRENAPSTLVNQCH